ncbi:hypothetical protein CN167_17490 [Sinorhizobium medicae]|uniref:hypothetical protein n=1 Tax=Sinorhizobium medicae TaxID=110321 RepID=UPI000FD6F42F|nr:hypothetical protein [Sinorhizobium medicae]RVJ74133.1 hypothetical protein CN167_17490 [Sinorhizobium medicae]
MSDVLKTLADLSAAATAIITILYLLALLGKGVMYAISIPGRVRRKLYKPMFIVLPTPEEVAIYCVKNDNPFFGSEAEWLEERRGGETRLYEAGIRKSKERIAMFYYGTYVAGALVIGRMLALNWSETDLKKNAATGLFSFLFLYLWVAFFPLLNPPRRSKTRLSTAWPRIWNG